MNLDNDKVMNTSIKIISSILILAFFSHCSKNEDPKPAASVNGQVVFWTHVDDNIGNVEVTLGGVKQTITKVIGIGGPACGQSGFATYQNANGSYSFTANEITTPFRKWSGNVSFTTDKCAKFQLLK